MENYLYSQLKKDNDFNNSDRSHCVSRLSPLASDRSKHKKINSYTPLHKGFHFPKQPSKQMAKKLTSTPTKKDTYLAKQIIDEENEKQQQMLIENLDFDKYKEIQTELDVIRRIQNIENTFQNEQKCKVLFHRYKIVEFSIALFCVISVSSGIIYHNFKTYYVNDLSYNQTLVQNAIYVSIIMVSVTTIFHIILSYVRYELIIQVQKASNALSKIDSIYTTGNMKFLMIEVFMAIIHPNIGFHFIYCTTNTNYYLLEITYNLNDFILLFLLLRCYTIFRFLICLTRYYGSKASRVLQMIGLELNRSFSLKCLMQNSSFIVLLVFACVFVVNLSFMLRIVEGPAFSVSKTMRDANIDFNIFQNCIWCVLVTMTTVGYGDYYPTTNLGRLIIIVTAIIGNIIISLIIVSMQNIFMFTENEKKAYETQTAMTLKAEIERYSVLLFQKTCKYKVAKKKFINSFCAGFYSKGYMKKMKNNLETALYQNLRIKKKFKAALHKYQNLYEAQGENDYIKEKLELMRENIAFFSDRYERLQSNVSSIKDMIDNLNNRMKLKYLPD